MKIVKRCTKKSKAKKAVVMVKGCACDEIYSRLDTKKVRRSCTDWLGRETKERKIYSM